MAQAHVAPGWDLEVNRGPDWLIVRPRRIKQAAGDASLADQVWALLEQSLTRRVVLQLGEIESLDRSLVGELSKLQERAAEGDGVMRVCGLSAANEQLLHKYGDGQIANYSDCKAAVNAEVRPRQPR